jgi:hypothetical protein
MAGFAMAGFAMAGLAMAGFAMAGFAMAGFAMAGFAMAGFVFARADPRRCWIWHRIGEDLFENVLDALPDQRVARGRVKANWDRRAIYPAKLDHVGRLPFHGQQAGVKRRVVT